MGPYHDSVQGDGGQSRKTLRQAGEVLDQNLVQRYLRGDDHAFWNLLAENLGVIDLVLGAIDYFRRRPIEREEAAMAAADRAYEKRHLYEGKGKFQAWLARLARNVAWNRIPGSKHRRRVRETVSIDADTGSPATFLPVDPDAEKSVLLREVSEQLDKLEEQERLSITLFFVTGLTDKEIAGVLDGRDPRGIPALRHRALAKLRRRLAPLDGGAT